MTSLTRIELRTGGGISVTAIASGMSRSDYANLHCKGLSAGSHARVERFYDRIDRDLAEWERGMFPKKKRRRGKKRRNRHGKPVQLLKSGFGKEARHA